MMKLIGIFLRDFGLTTKTEFKIRSFPLRHAHWLRSASGWLWNARDAENGYPTQSGHDDRLLPHGELMGELRP